LFEELTAMPHTRTRWDPYVERYRKGESCGEVLRDMILEDARGRGAAPTLTEIGCGFGFQNNKDLQESVARVAGRYIGVEPDPHVEPDRSFTEVHRCLFEDAPLRPGSVDVAFAIFVLEHLPAPQALWDKLWDVLKDGGVFWALTPDARHWFCRASLWAERLRVKGLYLNALHGRRGVDRYPNYPTYYRSNTPRQVGHYARRFRSLDFINLAQVGQCNYYYPRWLRRVGDLLDRRAIRRGKPGLLLAVRAVK
jgi:SAM-dependent methyltransferase